MPFIVETGTTHPGIKMYVTEAEGTGRRKRFVMEGVLGAAFEFPIRADAANAVAQFSSMYGLTIVELKKETTP